MSFRVKSLTLGLLVAMFAASPVLAAGPEWMHDFEKAKAKALAEKKAMLVDFTGSDWCAWCKRLSAEVFTKDEFLAAATKNLVLVELDFPSDKSSQSEELQAQNEKLKEIYSISGFPTVLLTDAEGIPFATTGYQEGGPEAYITHLHDLLAIRDIRDAAFAKAEKATGLEQARLLAEGLEAMDGPFLSTFYSDQIARVMELDPTDSLGKKEEFTDILNEGRIKEFVEKYNDRLQTVSTEGPDAILKVLDEALAEKDMPRSLREQFVENKLRLLMNEKRTEDALAFLDETVKEASSKDRGEALLRKAVITYRLGKTEEALGQLDAIAAEQKEDELLVNVFFNKGKILAQENRAADAIAAFESANKHADVDAQKIIGDILARLKAANKATETP
ncbi:thioredoxin family protein [Lignipirellula cremea]|uniref:Disulfide bond reductase DsbH n=1 Tax=Lignipirellula cremea TaxID=2528010 RepID=A0A518DN76_9BACT|nr:thioredoxin family protein [Lignipirellula cremea]QDU93273.1 Disulfide bond reductase DsbH precursor [Lignipirellula cremea]